MNNNILTELIQERLETTKDRQVDIAKRAGVNKRALHRHLEEVDRIPDIKTLVRYRKALKIGRGEFWARVVKKYDK